MSPVSLEPVIWTFRRWSYAFAMVFLAQIAAIWFLEDRPKNPPAPAPFRTEIHLAVDPWSAKQLAELPALSDPTVFVLPNRHGFSGPAWLTFAPQVYALTNWTEEPRWLGLKQEDLGKTFLEFVATNVSPPLLIANQSMPRSIVSDLVAPNLSGLTQSVFRIEGDLGQRRLLTPLVLPPWPHTDLLANTVVQAVVDAQGNPFSTVLLASSGLRDADQFALKLVADSRFEPMAEEKQPKHPADRLVWGRIIFQWHTLPPPTTNLSTGLP